jgi:hypothetical protein
MKLEKLRPHFQPAWSFLVALGHALQEGENELSALDAFWLGLIDEVLGSSDLPLTRYFAEFHPDPEPEALPVAAAEATPAEEVPGPGTDEPPNDGNSLPPAAPLPETP